MKEIKYPLESFYWSQHDEQGNVIREIRDADRNTVFFMRIKGRDFQESARFTEELCPLVVRLMNQHQMSCEQSRAIGVGVDAPISNGNGHSTLELPKRRGRPPKAKA